MGAAVGQVPEYIEMVTAWCKQYSRLPVIVKLTPNITDIRMPAAAAKKGGADAGTDAAAETSAPKRIEGPKPAPTATPTSNGQLDIAICAPNAEPFSTTLDEEGVLLDNVLAFRRAKTVPGFTVQPQSQLVLLGQSANFTPTVTGDPVISYKWKKGTAFIANATSSSYDIAIGPGLGRELWGQAMFDAAIESALPKVVDADGHRLVAEAGSERGAAVLARVTASVATDGRVGPIIDDIRAALDALGSYGRPRAVQLAHCGIDDRRITRVRNAALRDPRARHHDLGVITLVRDAHEMIRGTKERHDFRGGGEQGDGAHSIDRL